MKRSAGSKTVPMVTVPIAANQLGLIDYKLFQQLSTAFHAEVRDDFLLMDISILYEDDDVLVINKPHGVVVNRADTVQGETIQEWMEEKLEIRNPASPARLAKWAGRSKFENSQSNFVARGGVVHRLDKDTSGCLLLAKNEQSFLTLQKQFHDRVIEKVYTALVHGEVVPVTGSVRAPVGRLPWNRQRFGVYPGGREAQTDYRVEQVFSYGGGIYSLLSFFPKSGRTHQLRAHAKYMGHPIVADPWYTGEKTTRSDSTWCPRLFLHAAKITFAQPTTGKPITVEAPLPEELKKALEQLRSNVIPA